MEKINQNKYLINMVLHDKIEKSLPSAGTGGNVSVSRLTVRASLNTLLEEKISGAVSLPRLFHQFPKDVGNNDPAIRPGMRGDPAPGLGFRER